MGEEHIGNGIYVTFDGRCFNLHKPQTANIIDLDEAQLRKLLDYIGRALAQREDHNDGPRRILG